MLRTYSKRDTARIRSHQRTSVMASVAREFNPDLLEKLGDRYSRSSVEELVALWLMEQLAEEEAAGSLQPEEACQFECLRCELKDWSVLNMPELQRRGSW